MTKPTVWFNPRCSKCRTAQGILEEHGVDADYFRYLEQMPTRDDLERVLELMGSADPGVIARTGEALWTELGLDDASNDEVLDAMAANPSLIERPILIVGDRAIVARPPERLLELLGDGGASAALESRSATELS